AHSTFRRGAERDCGQTTVHSAPGRLICTHAPDRPAVQRCQLPLATSACRIVSRTADIGGSRRPPAPRARRLVVSHGTPPGATDDRPNIAGPATFGRRPCPGA